MKVIGIIPARMASSRFPGKPMKKIYGIHIEVTTKEPVHIHSQVMIF